ncbi:MAG: glycosyltransferase family 4 protein [Candidatus Levybacteria bacterium]|nr:glycosyltransferase family 4 protein [Candidatus Levybacteria bacterium]
MKIGIDCRLWNQTGVGRYTRNLIDQLAQVDRKNQYILFVRRQDYDQVELKILAPRSLGEAGKNLKFKIVKVNILWHSLKEQVVLPEILNRENLDLMHFPYFSAPIYYKRPFITTIHDLIQLHFPTGRASTLPWPFYAIKYLGYKYIVLKTSQRAKKIIAVSNSTRAEIIDHLKIDPKKIEVIYEGVEPAFRKKGIESSLGIAKRYGLNANRYFLFVGNVYPHKNSDTLIKAFAIFLKYYPDANLIFVGKEDYFYRKLKENVRKMELSGNIKFLGNVPDEDLSNLYKNAIAQIIPSFMEGFGLPALEAMTSKCLVIASNISSLKEVCGENVVYFDPYNEKDLEEKMKMAYDKNFDQKIIESGFERSQQFSWRKMAEQTLKIYEKA